MISPALRTGKRCTGSGCTRAISDESEGSQADENSRATLYLEEEFELVNMAKELPLSDPALEKYEV